MRQARLTHGDKLGGDEPDHRADFELLRGRLDAALTGISFWRPFTVRPGTAHTPRVPRPSAGTRSMNGV